MADLATLTAQFETRLAARRDESRTRLEQLKKGVIEPLRKADIATVEITFEGYGDSGAIEEINCSDAEGKAIACPPKSALAGSERASGTDEAGSSLSDDLEALAYLALELHHPGWEINEGASGSLEIDVAEGSFVLGCDIRVIDHDSHSTAL